MSEPEIIIMYGTTWCGSSRRARLLLENHAIPYRWVDIEADAVAARTVENINNGNRSVPTLVWPDGSVLVEPSNEQLLKKLGITKA